MIAPARVARPAFRLALTAAEAADALAISPRTLASLTAAGEIPVSRIGTRNLRYPLSALERWLASKTTLPAEMGHSGPEQQAGYPDDRTEDTAAAANRTASGGMSS